jgi:hypothetical protein
MRRHALLALLLVVVCAASARAQAQDPVGPFVVDVRGLMASLPTTSGWVAAAPAGTVVPSRGFGLDFAAHVYPVQWGPARIGLGAALGFARGTATAADTTTPDVVTRSRTLAPQVSFNFGHRLGWSYLSVGYGAAKIASEAAAFGLTPAAESDPGWSGAINFGGGARWFITEHVGVGFDARWHRLSAREASLTSVAAPRATLFHLGVGVTLH